MIHYDQAVHQLELDLALHVVDVTSMKLVASNTL
jgi:hypothetical protein